MLRSEMRQAIRRNLEDQLFLLESSRCDAACGPCADENELASVLAEAHFKMTLQGRVSRQIRQVQTALRKLEATGYGVCEECGEDIGAARLWAQPTAVFCVECQEEVDAAVPCAS